MLDKGLVIAGDVRISLANVELLTIRIRLLVCSVDKAEQIGLNWWKFDPNLTHPAGISRGTRTQLPRPGPGTELRLPVVPAKRVAAKESCEEERRKRKDTGRDRQEDWQWQSNEFPAVPV